jgi:hypothetical protein
MLRSRWLVRLPRIGALRTRYMLEGWKLDAAKDNPWVAILSDREGKPQ